MKFDSVEEELQWWKSRFKGSRVEELERDNEELKEALRVAVEMGQDECAKLEAEVERLRKSIKDSDVVITDQDALLKKYLAVVDVAKGFMDTTQNALLKKHLAVVDAVKEFMDTTSMDEGIQAKYRLGEALDTLDGGKP